MLNAGQCLLWLCIAWILLFVVSLGSPSVATFVELACSVSDRLSLIFSQPPTHENLVLANTWVCNPVQLSTGTLHLPIEGWQTQVVGGGSLEKEKEEEKEKKEEKEKEKKEETENDNEKEKEKEKTRSLPNH